MQEARQRYERKQTVDNINKSANEEIDAFTNKKTQRQDPLRNLSDIISQAFQDE